MGYEVKHLIMGLSHIIKGLFVINDSLENCKLNLEIEFENKPILIILLLLLRTCLFTFILFFYMFLNNL